MKTLRNPTVVVGLLNLAVALSNESPAALGQSLYHVQLLGDLPGALEVSHPEDINDLGQVTGTGTVIPYNEAFLYDPDVGMFGLGYLPSSQLASSGESINNIGHVAGVAQLNPPSAGAFLWTPETGMIGLGDLPGGNIYSWAYGINDHDQVVGMSRSNSGGGIGFGDQEAFIWDTIGGIRGLGDLPGGGFGSLAYAINNRGEVTGRSSSWRASDEAFIWDEVNGMRILGDIPNGVMGIGWDINNLGQITGVAYTVDGPQAYLWDRNEGTRLSGFLPGSTDGVCIGFGLNDLGQVVGKASYDHPFVFTCFIWDREHGLRDLGHLVDAAGRRYTPFVSARAINNRGEIALYANAGGATGGILLIPFTLADMNCDGSVNAFDIDGFILTLSAVAGDAADAAEYAERYPGCHGDWAADADQDGSVNAFDIGAFVGMLGG